MYLILPAMFLFALLFLHILTLVFQRYSHHDGFLFSLRISDT